MSKHTQSTLDLTPIIEDQAVWSNHRTIIKGAHVPERIYGTVEEVRGNVLPYVIVWENGKREIHARTEIVPLTYDEIIAREA